LSKYVDDNPEFSFKSGVLEGRVISMKEIKALATMPSKEELYSKLLFLISSPAQRLVTVMNAVGRDLGSGREPGRGEEEVQGCRRRGGTSRGRSQQLDMDCFLEFFLGT